MRTPFDDDMGKFTWFLFRVYPRPFLLTLSLPFLPSNISLFSRIGWLVGWLVGKTWVSSVRVQSLYIC